MDDRPRRGLTPVLATLAILALALFIFSFFGISATNASLVNNRVATLAELANAVLVTFAGSITPALIKSS